VRRQRTEGGEIVKVKAKKGKNRVRGAVVRVQGSVVRVQGAKKK
jgi:hypothetical protein